MCLTQSFELHASTPLVPMLLGKRAGALLAGGDESSEAFGADDVARMLWQPDERGELLSSEVDEVGTCARWATKSSPSSGVRVLEAPGRLECCAAVVDGD